MELQRLREARDGHELQAAARIKELRGRLLEAHAQMIRRDDELRQLFNNATDQRIALLIERDNLYAERDALISERDALLAERQALYHRLHSAERRLVVFRSSPLGLAYRALRKLLPWGGRRD
jgi:hypothetical protein